MLLAVLHRLEVSPWHDEDVGAIQVIPAARCTADRMLVCLVTRKLLRGFGAGSEQILQVACKNDDLDRAAAERHAEFDRFYAGTQSWRGLHRVLSIRWTVLLPERSFCALHPSFGGSSRRLSEGVTRAAPHRPSPHHRPDGA